MYLLKLNKVTDLKMLKSIYSSIYDYKLFGRVFIVYKADLNTKNYKIPNLICDVMIVDLKDFKGVDDLEMEDIIFDLVEVKCNLFFSKEKVSIKLQRKIEDMFGDCGLKPKYLEELSLENPINIKNLSHNDVNVIHEIFGSNTNERSYSPRDFLVRIEIDSNGSLRLEEGRKIGILSDNNFLELLFKSSVMSATKVKEIEENCDKGLFSSILYEPWYFLKQNENIYAQIEEYKKNVFNVIKNINPSEYKYLPVDIVKLLNSAEYIKFDDIIKIISKRDEFLCYYK